MHVGQFLLHQQAAYGREEGRDSSGGAVGAVGAAERIVHKNLRERGKLLRQFHVVLFLAGVEPHVFQQQHPAIRQGFRFGFGFRAHAGFGKLHRHAEQRAQRRGDGTQTLFRIDLTLRTAEVAAQNDFGALSDQILQCRQGFLDAGGIGDDHGALFLLQRHIEVHAHEAAFAGRIDITDAFFGHKSGS